MSAPSFVCSICDESPSNGKRGYCDSNMCAFCYVDSRVDGLIDLMEEREQYTKRIKPEVYNSDDYNTVRNYLLITRKWILQVGGTTPKKDQRLFNHLVEAFERIDEILLEHPDEQEYEEEK